MDKPYSGFTAVLYARVSTDDKGQTTESQIREMRKWCAYNEVEILGEYQEEKSAKNLDRPEFDRVMGRIMRGGINILLAWDTSRLSRSTEDMTEIVKNVRQFGTVIRYVANSNTPETSEGQLMNNIGSWQAESERKKLSLNTKNGMKTAALKGVHCGRPLTICFSNHVEENKAKLSPNGNTLIVDIEIVMEYAKNGYSIEQTAKALRKDISRKALTTALEKEGRLEEFRSIYWSQKRRAKGYTCERVESIYTNPEKKEVE